MTRIARSTAGRGRLRLTLAAAAALTAFTLGIGGAAAAPAESGGDTGRPPPGYLLERGRFMPVTLPPGVEDPTALGIGPTDLNDRRHIVGSYDDVAADATRGFLLERGRFATFSVPGAQVTFPLGIHDQGQIVGFSISSPTATTPSGFLRDARGRFTAINRPGAVGTAAFDINDRGQIAIIAPAPGP